MDHTPREVIKKIALAVFKDKKVLMARYKNNPVFYFIGGRIREGETDEECLIRKVPDEVGAAVIPESIHFLESFSDEADGRNNSEVQIRLYKGELVSNPVPNNDVEEIKYVDSFDDSEQLSAIAVNKIIPWLKEKGYSN